MRRYQGEGDPEVREHVPGREKAFVKALRAGMECYPHSKWLHRAPRGWNKEGRRKNSRRRVQKSHVRPDLEELLCTSLK